MFGANFSGEEKVGSSVFQVQKILAKYAQEVDGALIDVLYLPSPVLKTPYNNPFRAPTAATSSRSRQVVSAASKFSFNSTEPLPSFRNV
jgi:hypothetical protein